MLAIGSVELRPSTSRRYYPHASDSRDCSRPANRTSRNRHARYCFPDVGRPQRLVDYQLPGIAEGRYRRRPVFVVHIDSVPVGTSYDDTTDVDPENAYRYRIKARNAQGVGPQSASVSVTTLAIPGTVPTFADDTGVSTKVWAPNTDYHLLSPSLTASVGSPTPSYARSR